MTSTTKYLLAGGAIAALFLLAKGSPSSNVGSTDLTGLKVGDKLRVDAPGHPGSPTGDVQVVGFVSTAKGNAALVKMLTGGDAGKGPVPLDSIVANAQQAGGKVTRV